MQHAAQRREVRHKARQLVVDTWQTEAILSVFLGMLVLIVFVFPMTKLVSEHVNIYIDIAYSTTAVLGIGIARRDRALFFPILVLGTVSLVLRWSCPWHPALVPYRETLMMVNIVLFALVLLRQVFAHGRVTAMRIQGAVAVYLLFGIGWAHAFQLINASAPHAFFIQNSAPETVSEWLYYSFTTLTTVGYGDIVPTARAARMLAVAEALTGQLYLTVLVARLVGLQVSENSSPGA